MLWKPSTRITCGDVDLDSEFTTALETDGLPLSISIRWKPPVDPADVTIAWVTFPTT